MNLIWICADTFRNDHLGCMGNNRVKTPRLDKLASEGILFENAYAEGLPTGPERAVFMTGKFMLPFRGWTPLIKEDVTLAEHLVKKGYRTALHSDCYHMFKPNYNYHRGFEEFRWIRGQEQDNYVSANKGKDPLFFMPERTNTIPLAHKKGGAQRGYERYLDPLAQYLRNVADRGEDETEYFPAQTVSSSMKWLEDNRDAENFLLWVEMFDPHEPWDPPPKYYDMYRNPNYTGPNILSPWFHSTVASDYTEEELEDILALYAGEVTLVDTWVGKLLDKVDELGLRDNTAIVFVSDHGVPICDRGIMGKFPKVGSGMCRHTCNQPLIIRHPEFSKGKRIKELVWSPDYMPTCCEMLGVEPPETVHGRSFWKLVTDDDKSVARDHIISGRFKDYYYVVDEKWSFFPESRATKDELYERASDPFEEGANLADKHPDVCNELRQKLQKHLDLANTLHM